MSDQPEPSAADTSQPRSRTKLVVQYALTIVVIVAVFGFVIPQLADYREVLDLVGRITAWEWVVLGSLAGLFLVGYMFVLMATLPSLRFREAFVVQTTATAINNSVPAGGAISLPIQYAMYLSWGFTAEAVTASFLTAGVWDQVIRLAVPVLAVTVIALFGQAVGWMWAASLVGIALVAGIVVLLILLFRSESFAARIGGWLGTVVNWVLRRIRRDEVDLVEAVLQFRRNVIGVVARRWQWVTLATVGNNLAQLALFVACLRVVGVTSDDISTPWIVLSYSLGRLLVAIPVSPGGVGLVDLGFIGLLAAGWDGSADEALITTAVLLFRLLSWLPPIPIGVGSWIFWRANRSWHQDWRTMRRGERLSAAVD